MPASIRSVATPIGGNGNLVVNKPSGVVSGDLLIAVMFQGQFWSITNMTAPSDWTQSGADGGDSSHSFGRTWTKVATGSEPSTYTFTDQGAGVVIVVCVTGQDTVTPLSVTPTYSVAASSVNQMTPSVTPTVNNGLLVCAWGDYDSTPGTSYSVPGSMALQGQLQVTQKNCVATELLSGGPGSATGTRTAICSHAGNAYISMTMVIAPLPVTSGPITQVSQYGSFH